MHPIKLPFRVSIHAPTRGATTKGWPYIKKTVFQSTHPHGVRHPVGRLHKALRIVSIHAPTRGATVFLPKSLASALVSIHAPTRGATALRAYILSPYRFQSTHPHGVRPARARVVFSILRVFQSTHPHGVRHASGGCFPGTAILVSIHAPTRGATRFSHGRRYFKNVSIHAPTRGATSSGRSRSHRGVCFNPRTHTGCDALL